MGQTDVALQRYTECIDRWWSEPRPTHVTGQRWMDLGYLTARFHDTARAQSLIELLEPYETVMFAPLVTYHTCAYVLGLLWDESQARPDLDFNAMSRKGRA